MLQVKSGLLIASLHPLPDGTRSTIFNGQAISACAARLATRNRAVSSQKSGVPIAQCSPLTPDPKKNRFINRSLMVFVRFGLFGRRQIFGGQLFVLNFLWRDWHWGVHPFVLLLYYWKIDKWFRSYTNYFTSSDPHHDMLGGGCQVRVVIENMMGRMENLRTLISGFLGLVILVRWALVTMFLSWTTQTGCRIHRTYVSLIGSGEGRHTTHLLKCVPLLSTSQTDWKQSSDVLSDISFDILSNISSDIFFWYIFWHSFWHIFWHSFWHLSDISFDILSDKSFDTLSDISSDNFLTYLSTCFLTYLLTFFLTYQNQNLTSTASHKKPLCKLYIYLTPRSKSNIHDNFVPVNVIALSASDRPAKRQLSPKMQNACSSTHTHTHTHHMHQTAPPNSSWVQTCKRV